MPIKIAVIGAGRVGRAIIKNALKDDDFSLVGVSDLYSSADLAYLLRFDSSQTPLEPIREENGRFFYAAKSFQYEQTSAAPSFKADFLIDASGAHKTTQDLAQLSQNAPHLALTYTMPALPIHIYGLSRPATPPPAFCVGTCTAVPFAIVSEILDKNFGIAGAFASSIHSFNADQALHDRADPSRLLARAAPRNIILTASGAAPNAAKILGHLAPHLASLGIRIPTPAVCALDLSFFLKRHAPCAEILSALKTEIAARFGEIMGVSSAPLVSSDLRSSTKAGVIDESLCLAMDNLVKIFVWHNNESGYASYVLKTIKRIKNELG